MQAGRLLCVGTVQTHSPVENRALIVTRQSLWVALQLSQQSHRSHRVAARATDTDLIFWFDFPLIRPTIEDWWREVIYGKGQWGMLSNLSHTDWSGFKQVTSIRDHSFYLDSPGQSTVWKEQVFLILCTHTHFILTLSILSLALSLPVWQWLAVWVSWLCLICHERR